MCTLQVYSPLDKSKGNKRGRQGMKKLLLAVTLLGLVLTVPAGAVPQRDGQPHPELQGPQDAVAVDNGQGHQMTTGAVEASKIEVAAEPVQGGPQPRGEEVVLTTDTGHKIKTGRGEITPKPAVESPNPYRDGECLLPEVHRGQWECLRRLEW